MLGVANGHALPDLAGQERRRIHMGSPTISTWIRRVHWVLFTASAIGRQCLDLWRLSLAGTSRRLLALVTEAMRSSFRVSTSAFASSERWIGEWMRCGHAHANRQFDPVDVSPCRVRTERDLAVGLVRGVVDRRILKRRGRAARRKLQIANDRLSRLGRQASRRSRLRGKTRPLVDVPAPREGDACQRTPLGVHREGNNLSSFFRRRRPHRNPVRIEGTGRQHADAPPVQHLLSFLRRSGIASSMNRLRLDRSAARGRTCTSARRALGEVRIAAALPITASRRVRVPSTGS